MLLTKRLVRKKQRVFNILSGGFVSQLKNLSGNKAYQKAP